MIIVHVTSQGSKQGKTTIASRLIRKLVAAGARVCAVKHSHHTLDIRDKDTHRLHGMGSKITLGIGTGELLVKTSDLDPIMGFLWETMSKECDYVVVEGFKESLPHPLVGKASALVGIRVKDGRPQAVEPLLPGSESEKEAIRLKNLLENPG